MATRLRRSMCIGAACGAICCSSALAADVKVTIKNLAPQNGTYLTPFWVGFHNGSFDTYDMGAAASMGLERIAEDGNTGPLMDAFMMSGAGMVQGTIASGGIPPIEPGEETSMSFDVDPFSPMSRYFSYASMIIPSNDAFVANGNPTAHQVFGAGGNFIPVSFIIMGTSVNDAGTEVNDEIPMNTAFFGQMNPNTGTTENGVVHVHPGFLGSAGNPGTKSILADPMFANADFTLPGYMIAQITITPEPSTLAVLALGLAGLGRRRTA